MDENEIRKQHGYYKDETTGTYYERYGTRWLPSLLGDMMPKYVGRYYKLRMLYLCHCKPEEYLEMYNSRTIKKHLEDTVSSAESRYYELVKSIGEAEGFKNDLLNTDFYEWYLRSRDISRRAEEQVVREIIMV